MENTYQLITLLASVGAQIHASATDGDGLNVKDAPDFLDEALRASAVLKGLTAVPSEIRLASPEDLENLFSRLSGIITGLTPDRFDAFVDAAFNTASGFIYAFNQFKDLS